MTPRLLYGVQLLFEFLIFGLTYAREAIQVIQGIQLWSQVATVTYFGTCREQPIGIAGILEC